ncbi:MULTISPECIES: EAL domain-containing protein [unclassified Erwinia]|uniref:EAL domain-containing protein n=1 Tax=unclassified Erwinia TaxID=2622719 RepID=UPI0006F516DE|nr:MULTISPECIES: EAL domain-containing protein [unclassified Erwinia]KQN64086.1 diguanylate phosphodiesterase [Erwinia sp. Leaf53]PLV49440.1 diguanylate phosphodiesterase [Erwinia sp. B116]
MHRSIKSSKSILCLLFAGQLPLLLCLVFTFIEARQIVKRQLEITATMLLTQADHISDQAWTMNDRLRQFSTRDCPEVKSTLQQFGTLYPYFRSIGLTQNDEIYCSSAYGELPSTLERMIRRPLPALHKAWWTLSLAGTAGVLDRPAVLFMRETPDAFGTYALVDGQYLIDVMRAAGDSRNYRIALQFGDGYRIVSDDRRDRPQGWAVHTLNASSQRYPIGISLSAPPEQLLKNWYQALLTFLPMAVIFSLLAVTLTRSWLQRRHSFGDEIYQGLKRREFSVVYQPVGNLNSGEPGGVEALMRWQRKDGSWVRPDIFIAAAEAEGLIIPLTRYLLDSIVAESAHWRVAPGFHLGVNVAAEHLQHPEFIADIRRFAAGVARMQPSITLELTERSLIEDGTAVALKLAQLRSEGIRIAIDDFGTGHSSMAYLHTFPLDYLKIDRGFVSAIDAADANTPILDAIIRMAHGLQLQVVAEGVEDETQLRYLQQHGVAFIQGYYYARPMNSEALMQWLQQPGELLKPR